MSLALKERKPSQDEMLEQLAEAVDLNQRGPEARKIHAQLKASIWTPEDRERGRELGREANALKATEARVLWRKEAIRLIVDGYAAGVWVFRDSLIEGIHSYCFSYSITGIRGSTIQKTTIRRWLTSKREEEIYLEAVTQIKAKP